MCLLKQSKMRVPLRHNYSRKVNNDADRYNVERLQTDAEGGGNSAIEDGYCPPERRP